MEAEEHRQYFRCFSGKRNFAPSVEDSDWYHIKSLQLMNGPANYPEDGDNIGVVETWTPPAPKEITSVVMDDIVREVASGEWRDDIRSPMWVGKAIASAFNIDPEDQKDQIKGVIKALLKDGTLKRVAGRNDDHKACIYIRVGTPKPVEQKPVEGTVEPARRPDLHLVPKPRKPPK